MKYILYKQCLVIGTIILLFGTSFSVGNVNGNSINIGREQSKEAISTENDVLLNYQETLATEYWALIFAVGIYKNHPQQNRPSMLQAAEDLYDVLLSSSQWQADHIHKVTGSSCYLSRLLQELNWLIQNAGTDDMVLVYLTTHGSPLKDPNGNPLDIPPKDEADGADEILAMYDSFDQDFGFIWDDLLNFYLSRIKSTGICLIVDSCYSGGFNDILAEVRNFNSLPVSEDITREGNICNKVNDVKSRISTKCTITTPNKLTRTGINLEGNPSLYESKSNKVTNKIKDLEAYLFTQGFIEDVSGQGRVILMACQEDQLSYNSDFSNFLIDGFWGWADFYGNGNGINSAEESFDYADWWVNIISGGYQDPTIVDNFPGEFTITYT